MNQKPTAKIVQVSAKRLSLQPLSFDDAVTDILKIKPEPKSQKSKTPVNNKPTGDARRGR